MHTVILDTEKIHRIIHRIAYQVLEECYEEPSITLVGIMPRGAWVAQRIQESLRELVQTPVHLVSLDAQGLNDLQGKCVLLVDDIVNSGDTMMRAASLIMSQNPKRLITACLIDRKHRRFPITSDFTGLSLATTMQEHLRLEVGENPVIYLE